MYENYYLNFLKGIHVKMNVQEKAFFSYFKYLDFNISAGGIEYQCKTFSQHLLHLIYENPQFLLNLISLTPI